MVMAGKRRRVKLASNPAALRWHQSRVSAIPVSDAFPRIQCRNLFFASFLLDKSQQRSLQYTVQMMARTVKSEIGRYSAAYATGRKRFFETPGEGGR